MSFDITYSDEPGLTLYANLFDSVDLSKAWNLSSSSFESFSLSSQSDFALLLTEDDERVGFYSYTVNENIAAVTGDDFYLIEVREKSGSSYDRSNDEILGTVQFFWNGEKETAPFSENLKQAPTAQEIWEYINRTLTESPCEDYSELLNLIKTEIEKISSDVNNIENDVEQIKENTQKQEPVTVVPQSPRIGPNGLSEISSGIRVK